MKKVFSFRCNNAEVIKKLQDLYYKENNVWLSQNQLINWVLTQELERRETKKKPQKLSKAFGSLMRGIPDGL
jgi:hypothetical protein